MIIGLTGTMAAGKDTVADYLVKGKGFLYHSLSDIVREEATTRGLALDRDTLRDVGNDLRHQHGLAVLAERVLERMKAAGEQRSVIVSIRNPAEVERLRQEPGFHLIAVDASRETRYERLQTRQRVGDAIDFDTFVAQEAKEMANADPANQQLRQVTAMADVTLQNEGTFDQLYANIEALLKQFAAE